MTLQAVAALGRTGNRIAGEFDDFGLGDIERQILEQTRPTQSRVELEQSEAGERAQRSFNVSEGIFERQSRAITGGAPVAARGGRDERQQRVSQRRRGLARVLADVGARNQASGARRGRQIQAQQGIQSLRDITDQQIVGGRSVLGGLGTEREVDFQRQLAAFRNRNAALVGAGVGAVASFFGGPAAGNAASTVFAPQSQPNPVGA